MTLKSENVRPDEEISLSDFVHLEKKIVFNQGLPSSDMIYDDFDFMNPSYLHMDRPSNRT